MTRKSLTGQNIVILVQNLPVPFDRRVWQEATSLSAAGAKVAVVCPADERHPPGRFFERGVRIIRYPAPKEAKSLVGYLYEYPWALACMFVALVRLRLQARIDVIHFCNPPDLLFLPALPFKLLLGARLIFDQHDLGPELARAKGYRAGPLLTRGLLALERLTYLASDHVIATNESYKATAMRRGGKRHSEVTVVRSGPPASWAEGAHASADWRRGHAYAVGYVGVMGRQEGIEYLLAAHQILLEREIDVVLNLVGAGPDLQRLKVLAHDMGIDGSVQFLGRLPDRELKEVLLSCDVCVNPDEVNELNDKSTMNKIVEYMALGRPIVQFDVTEGRFSAQEASRYADSNNPQSFADEIQLVLQDSRLAATMSQAGRTRFEALSWESQSETLIAAYVRLVESRRGSQRQ